MQNLKTLMFGRYSAALVLMYFVCTSAFAPPLPSHLSSSAHFLHGGWPCLQTVAVASRPSLAGKNTATTMMSGRKQHPVSQVRSTLQKLIYVGHLRSGHRLTPNSDARLHATVELGGGDEDSIGEADTASTAQDSEGLVLAEAAEPIKIKRLPFSVGKVVSSVCKVVGKIGDLPEDAADEGRFLMMAAFVGVLTGGAGASVFVAVDAVQPQLVFSYYMYLRQQTAQYSYK